MDTEKHIQYWADGVTVAWRTVPTLKEHGYYTEALFWAHLALEKALKAHVTRATRDVPPYINNLLRLAELAQVILEPREKDLCGRLNDLQLSMRYGDISELEPEEDEAISMLEQSEALWRSLLQKL